MALTCASILASRDHRRRWMSCSLCPFKREQELPAGDLSVSSVGEFVKAPRHKEINLDIIRS